LDSRENGKGTENKHHIRQKKAKRNLRPKKENMGRGEKKEIGRGGEKWRTGCKAEGVQQKVGEKKRKPDQKTG